MFIEVSKNRLMTNPFLINLNQIYSLEIDWSKSGNVLEITITLAPGGKVYSYFISEANANKIHQKMILH